MPRPPPPSDRSGRHDRILEILQAQGSSTYAELGRLLRVSPMTVRRDIDSLAGREAVIKTLGGARYSKVPQFLHETSLSSRIGVNRAAKERIAAAALALVRPQQTVFLDGSTTCIAFARQLARAPFAFTAVCNSALIALELGAASRAKVLCTGGEYDVQSACFVGPIAEEAATGFFVDAMFFSTQAFLPADGTYESSMGTLRVKQAVAKRAARRILLVDGSKFGRRALCRVIDAASIDVVVTDEQCPAAARRTLERAGRQVIVAPARPPRAGADSSP